MRAATLLIFFALAACGEQSDTPKTADPDSPTAESKSPAASTAEPATLAETPTDLDGLTIHAPAAWESVAPSSSMRKAQYVVDGAECVIFFFPSGAGTIDANLDRWCAQFVQPDGADSRERAEVSTRSVNDVDVTILWLTGRYVAETTPGSGVRANEPGWALLAAIVPSDDGAYYIKFTGPESTIADNRAAFDAMIASAG